MAGVLLCTALAACAPTTQRVRVDSVAAEAEARKQREVAVQAYLDDQKRLMRVSYPLQTRGADLCGEDIRYTTGMALANSSTLLGEPFKETAETSYRLTEQVQAVYVVPGSAADKGGVRAGDTLLQVGQWSITGAGPDAVKETLNQIQKQTQNGQPVRVDLLRPAQGKNPLPQKMSLLIVPTAPAAIRSFLVTVTKLTPTRTANRSSSSAACCALPRTTRSSRWSSHMKSRTTA